MSIFLYFIYLFCYFSLLSLLFLYYIYFLLLILTFFSYFGGWLCPNIYYLGHSGVANVGGLRIAGISGIYQSYDFNKGYYEKSPYNESQKRSSYHTREFEIFKLLQYTSPIDIFVSHEWPRSIMRFGNLQQLLRHKPYFRNEVDTIGSPSLMQLLRVLKPKFWFAAHMHCFYNATFTVSLFRINAYILSYSFVF